MGFRIKNILIGFFMMMSRPAISVGVDDHFNQVPRKFKEHNPPMARHQLYSKEILDFFAILPHFIF